MLIALFCTSSALASDLENWGTSGDWVIAVDHANGNGCLLQKDFEDLGIRVRFGYVPERDGGFFSALSKDWSDLTPGATGIVKFLTDKEKFAGDVEIIEEEDWKGGWAFFNNQNLVTEFGQRKTLTVIGPNGGSFDLDLSGTARALREVKKCQSAQ